MPINTLISSVMRWAERTFTTRAEVGAVKTEVKEVRAEIKANIPDWEAQDGEPGHIKNKPFGMTDSAILQSASYEFESDGASVAVDAPIDIEPGSRYTVVWDGVEYDLTAVYWGSYSYQPFLGDGTLYRTDFDNGVKSAPFCYIKIGNGHTLYAKKAGTHTFALFAQVPYTIDTVYLPKLIGAAGTVTNSEVFNGLNSDRASGEGSHAEGNGSASGAYSHAEGGSYSTSGGTASGNGSHAEGTTTTAEGASSHAEGSRTKAKGSYSHAEGREGVAYGEGSHVEGGYTQAKGTNSHAEGGYTKANGYAQHVQGKFNVEDSEGDTYAHIVGNGESDEARSNAHTLDWDGNAWFAGDVLIGGTSQAEASTSLTSLATRVDALEGAGGGGAGPLIVGLNGGALDTPFADVLAALQAGQAVELRGDILTGLTDVLHVVAFGSGSITFSGLFIGADDSSVDVIFVVLNKDESVAAMPYTIAANPLT